MDRLWSPWRSQYVTSAAKSEGCIFCDHLKEGDDEHAGILSRTELSFVVLNLFPYNSGHVMVAPIRHIGELEDLEGAELMELMESTRRSVSVLKEAMKPDGFNIGMNLGRIAGAGVPGHLHIHVVPRWSGDTNYMPVIGKTKVLPESLEQTGAKLRPLFDS